MPNKLEQNIALQHVDGVAWHPTKKWVVTVDRDGHQGRARGMTVCMGFNLESGKAQSVGALPFRSIEPPSSFIGVYHHPHRSCALILYRNHLLLIDYQAYHLLTERFLRDLHLPPITTGGWYPDGERFWTLHGPEHGPALWVNWDLQAHHPRILSLDNPAFRFHTAALHPGGSLIGACWHGGPCGFRILSEAGNGFGCYTQPAVARKEQVVRSPLFSPDGRRLVMLTNTNRPGRANIGTLAMYDLMTGDLVTEISTECSFQEVGVQFIDNGRTLAVALNTEENEGRITLYNLESGDPKYSQLMLPPIRSFAAHPQLSLYALALPTYVAIGQSEESDAVETFTPHTIADKLSKI